MSHGKETPRQKMIGMMYLVLTALLALNVSAEVLNAFVLVDNSLTKTANNYAKKNERIYTAFEVSYQENKDKVGPWKAKADSVKLLSQELFDYIYSLKLKIVKTAEGSTDEYEARGPIAVSNKSDNNIPGQIMILEKNGEQLKQEIEEYRSTLFELIGDTTNAEGLSRGISASLNTDPVEGNTGEMKPWESANFDHLPLSGVLTMLTKLQTDVRNAESDMINYLYSKIDAGSFKFNKIEAIVNAPTNYVLVGNEYTAEVFIAASDSTQEPIIELNGGSRLPIVDGKGQYRGNTSSVGFKQWGGVIKLESPATGDTLEYEFSSEYQVAEASLVVSPTKMNVFYIGVDNPVAVSVPGVPADKLSVSISGGSISPRGGGEYTVRVRQPGTTYVSVSADFEAGARSMGRKEFRVKRVPDPVAMIAGKKGGVIGKSVLMAQQGVMAVLENFDFDLTFTVVRFTVSATIKGYAEEATSNSNRFTQQQKNIIRQVAQGQKVYIENIKARGPDGTTRSLPAMSFKLQ